MLLPSEASFFFFHHLIKLSHLSSSSSSLRSLSSALISHQTFISPQHQSQSRRHRRRQHQPQSSPSPATAPAITVPRHRQPTPSSSRPRPSPAPATTLTSLLHRCRPIHALDPLRRSKPLTHLEVSAPTLLFLLGITSEWRNELEIFCMQEIVVWFSCKRSFCGLCKCKFVVQFVYVICNINVYK